MNNDMFNLLQVNNNNNFIKMGVEWGNKGDFVSMSCAVWHNKYNPCSKPCCVYKQKRNDRQLIIALSSKNNCKRVCLLQSARWTFLLKLIYQIRFQSIFTSPLLAQICRHCITYIIQTKHIPLSGLYPFLWIPEILGHSAILCP